MRKKSFNDKYPECPECSSIKEIVKNGHSRDKQRWRCKSCKRNFVIQKKEAQRLPKFEYIDLKVLSTFLYFVGVKVKDIFEYVIQSTHKDIKNEKIIYNWAKPFIKLNAKTESKLKYKLVSVRKLNIETLLKEFDNILGRYSNCAYWLSFNLNGDMHECSVVDIISTNRVNHNFDKSLKDKPFWFKILLFILIRDYNKKDICRLFHVDNADDLNQFENIYKNKKTINYHYKHSFHRVNEALYSDIKEKIFSAKNTGNYVKTLIFIAFDLDFDDLSIYIINKEF